MATDDASHRSLNFERFRQSMLPLSVGIHPFQKVLVRRLSPQADERGPRTSIEGLSPGFVEASADHTRQLPRNAPEAIRCHTLPVESHPKASQPSRGYPERSLDSSVATKL